MAIRFDRRAFTLAAALLLALAWAAGAGAQARVEEKVNLTVTGDIKALDAAARRITVESTSDDGIVYEVDRSATIMSGAQNLALSDLKVGWNVAMNGHRNGDSRLVTLIQVVKAPMP